jgi:acetyl esterase
LRATAPDRYLAPVSWLSALAERALGTIAGGISRLPAPVLRLLAGGPPVRVDGLELDADVQLGSRMLSLGGQRALAELGPARAREEMARNARIFAGSPPAMASIPSPTIPGPAGPIPARFYTPRDGAPPRPLVVYYHGGGWVVGDLDTHDATCRHLANETAAAVLDYRLAPEHRFPAAVDDAIAAFGWAVREAAALGADPARVSSSIR